MVREGYKMTELGEIPEDWEVKSLGEITKYRRGSFPQPYNLPEWYDDINGMPFVQVFDVDSNFKLKETTKRKISKIAAESSVFAKKGTVIITLQGTLGRTAITQYDAYIDRTLLLFTEYLAPIEKMYFMYALNVLFDFEKKKADGGVIKTITKETLTKFTVAFPPLRDQQKIADILSTVDEQLEQTNQLIDKTRELKKGLMQKLLTKGIGHTEFKQTEVGEIPVEWEITTIKEHAIDFRGGAPITPKDFSKEGFKVVPKKAVRKGGKLVIECENQTFVYNEFASKNKNSIINNQYLVTVLRDLVPTAPSIGLIVKFNTDDEYILAQGVYGLKLKSSLNENFLIQISNSYSFRQIMKSLKVGSTQVHLRNEDFLGVLIPYPLNEEQQKIADILTSVDDQLEDYKIKKAKIRVLKKGLMQQLLTGKIRVNA
ncbi:restriction endonuclease subunit S [Bacillus sp. DJP31]|uniref:restriction endonuclease subunit S n=1 Tax=Bacillus sp. DJP31 TaxID=3409789 RepID=UPI003BB71B9F